MIIITQLCLFFKYFDIKKEPPTGVVQGSGDVVSPLPLVASGGRRPVLLLRRLGCPPEPGFRHVAEVEGLDEQQRDTDAGGGQDQRMECFDLGRQVGAHAVLEDREPKRAPDGCGQQVEGCGGRRVLGFRSRSPVENDHEEVGEAADGRDRDTQARQRDQRERAVAAGERIREGQAQRDAREDQRRQRVLEGELPTRALRREPGEGVGQRQDERQRSEHRRFQQRRQLAEERLLRSVAVVQTCGHDVPFGRGCSQELYLATCATTDTLPFYCIFSNESVD